MIILQNNKNKKQVFASLNMAVLLIACLIFAGSTSFSQADSILNSQLPDTLKNKSLTSLKRLGAAEIERSISRFREDMATTRQDILLSNIKKEKTAANDYIKKGMDTAGLQDEVLKIENWYAITGEGIFTNKSIAQTYRDLITSEIILRELLSRSLARKTVLDKYYKNLINFRNRVDSLYSDSVLYNFSSDPVILQNYLQRLDSLEEEMKPADSTFKKALLNVQQSQKNIDATVNKLAVGIDDITAFQQQLANKDFEREFSNLGDTIEHSRPFGDVINFSQIKGGLALSFYLKNNAGKIFLLVLLSLSTAIFLRSLKKHLSSKSLLNTDYSGQTVLRYPYLSAILIVISLFQFIFLRPPFIFNLILWIISAICLTIIFKNFITKFWMYVWLSMCFLFLLSSADNLILQATRTERWIMLALSVAGTFTGIFVLLKGHKEDLKEKWTIYFIGFVVFMELASTIANFYGRYNLGKTLLTSGFINLIIAILFMWTVRLINESLSLASKVYERPDKKLFYINFQRVGDKVPPLFNVLLIIGWFVLFGRNFYSFNAIADPVWNFLFVERTIGSYTFTVKSLLIFFLILVLSTLTSKIVSFFASDINVKNSKTKTGGPGSWLLLVRIAIVSIGLFLAFAAAGFPMDRLTIITGALGVGIGFGLQTLVNNLVSGIIISFERPLNVGDIVEIGDTYGTMKSIGFRSSIIFTLDGADVVFPNGDLLNKPLINWTHTDSTRRLTVDISVAYGTDLKKAKEILLNLLINDERILQNPAPLVHVKDFDSSAIDMQLLFWVRNIKEWLNVKSDVMLTIDLAFKENEIVIPFPQQDVYIHNINNQQPENNKGKS